MGAEDIDEQFVLSPVDVLLSGGREVSEGERLSSGMEEPTDDLAENPGHLD